jgi:NADH-quinone oxidoreductase subunit J
MTPGLLLFAVCSFLCVAGALITVLSANPIRGALGLLTTIVGIAGLFLRLNAQFLAAMQLLVYAGAVVILFVFVIMLLGPTATLEPKTARLSMISRGVSGVLGLVVGGLFLGLLGSTKRHEFPVIGKDHGSVEAVGGQLFRDALVPFELATALLIVAVVGAIAVARSQHVLAKKKRIDNPTVRLFHGPLMDRDANAPLDGRTLQERFEDSEAARRSA